MDEELPLGTQIGFVKAIDEDSGDNAVIDYAIIGTIFTPLIEYVARISHVSFHS